MNTAQLLQRTASTTKITCLALQISINQSIHNQFKPQSIMSEFRIERLPIALTDERRAELEKRNTELDINLLVEGEKLDEARAEHKANTAPAKVEKKNNLQTIRHGHERLDVKVMEFVNEDQGTIEYIDEIGALVYTRALSLEERRQYRINFSRRKDLV